MIKLGLKCGINDFSERIACDADFFEVVCPEGNSLHKADDLFSDIAIRRKEAFIHLPTEVSYQGARTLLNIASRNTDVRNLSRETIREVLTTTSKYKPAGWVLHAPSRQNFSTDRGLFDPGSENPDLENSLDWIRGLGQGVLVENMPAAIRWNSQVYPTEPYDFPKIVDQGFPAVLDTGHLYTTTTSSAEYMRIVRDLLDKVFYFHIATLKEDCTYDRHGEIFVAPQPEFPNRALLENVLQLAVETEHRLKRDSRLVCEPAGNTAIHLANYSVMRKQIDDIMGRLDADRFD